MSGILCLSNVTVTSPQIKIVQSKIVQSKIVQSKIVQSKKERLPWIWPASNVTLRKQEMERYDDKCSKDKDDFFLDFKSLQKMRQQTSTECQLQGKRVQLRHSYREILLPWSWRVDSYCKKMHEWDETFNTLSCVWMHVFGEGYVASMLHQIFSFA